MPRHRLLSFVLCLTLLSAGCANREDPAVEQPFPVIREEVSFETDILPFTPEESEAPSVPDSPEPFLTESAVESSAVSGGTAAEPSLPDDTSQEQAIFAVAPLSDSLRAQITGVSFREEGPVTLDDLRLVSVTYFDFSGEAKHGELLVHHTLAQEAADIFAELYDAGFPIAQVALIDQYGGDDDASMEANNSSAFCTRNIAETDRYSNHSYGAAIDINPVQNPYVAGQTIKPVSAEAYLDRADIRPGMIVEGDACHAAFTSRGWTWGGVWPNPDYQHFEKAIG